VGVNVLDHQSWVEKVVRGYVKPSAANYEDCVQEGFIALLEAARTFDESRGFKFLTYATPAIHQRLQRFLRRSTTIHQPDIWSVEKREELKDSTPPPRNIDAASRALQGSESDEDFAEGLQRIHGMHTPASQESAFAAAEERALLREALAYLPARHREVIQRVALDGATFREVAEELGCRHQRVHECFVEAVNTVRDRLGLPQSASVAEIEAA
jgi:RNA polymerase sigma factor (sigma-70 family)